MTPIGRRPAYRPPDQLLFELGITRPEDLDIEVIAHYCRATVLYKPLRGCEARIVGQLDEALIIVNALSPRERQRFSIGHELGHWTHDRGTVAFSCEERLFNTEWSAHNPETRANEYASDLLLPSSMFTPRTRGQPLTFHTVKALAGSFETSLTATALRLVSHGTHPCMIVCNVPQKRKWFRRAPSLPDVFWPRDSPGKGTVAYGLLRGSDATAGSADTDAGEWIARPDSDGYTLQEDSIRILGDLVLSLLWWKDERQLLDLDRVEEAVEDEDGELPSDGWRRNDRMRRS